MEDMVEAVEARTWLKKKKASLPNALIMHFSSGSFRSARPPALNLPWWSLGPWVLGGGGGCIVVLPTHIVVLPTHIANAYCQRTHTHTHTQR